jgi:hypothetical protein
MSRQLVKGWSRMAKGKRALFEVLQKDKRFQCPDPSPPPAASAAPSPQIQKIVNPFRPAQVAEPVAKKVVEVKPPGPSLKERVTKAYTEARARLQPWITRIRPYAVEHGGIVVGVLAAATMIGIVELARRANHSPTIQPVAIASIEDIRAENPNPSVLDVSNPSDDAQVTQSPAPTQDLDAADISADAAAARPAAGVFTPTARQVNLNYLLIQSYGDQKTAQEARDFLIKNGVPATIEQGINGWRKDFYLVVGLQGFPRASGPEYTAYRKKILEISELFAPPHSYKRFDPIAIKWAKTD